MAFGRSNSLSLNTGATNSLFGQQTQSSQPPASNSLFGNTASQSTTKPLFGASTNTSQPAQTGSIFGGTTNNNNNTTNAGSSSLFGGNTQQSQPQQNTPSLFGASTQQAQPQQSGHSLFGGNTQQTQTQQGGGGLFGGLSGASQNQNQQSQGSSMFGGLNQNQQNQNQNQGNSMFGGLNQNQQSNTNQQQSLHGASVFNQSTSNMGNSALKLTMGQGQAQSQTVPGVKVDISNIRPTTRFSDLHDDIKKQIEQIDTFIKQQESYASQCEALLPNHSDSIASVTPDVDFVAGKVETVELSLENDSRNIKFAKDLLNDDAKDFTRCVRVIENLALPSQYHYGQSTGTRTRIGEEEYDVDLIGYFSRQAEAMQKTLDTFTSNLTEIESHLRVIEANTVQQSQQVAAQRAGGTGNNDSVRELADTLRGFENGILDAAGFVGACREGVNELILGRITDGRESNGHRRY